VQEIGFGIDAGPVRATEAAGKTSLTGITVTTSTLSILTGMPVATDLSTLTTVFGVIRKVSTDTVTTILPGLTEAAGVLDFVGDDIFDLIGDDILDLIGNDVLDFVRNDVLDLVGNDVLDLVGNDVLDFVRNDVLDLVRDDVLLEVKFNEAWQFRAGLRFRRAKFQIPSAPREQDHDKAEHKNNTIHDTLRVLGFRRLVCFRNFSNDQY